MEEIHPTAKEVNNGVHRHDFHELFFFSTGTGRHMVDLEQHGLTAPCMHVVTAGQVHQLVRSADMRGVVVMFDPNARLLSRGLASMDPFSTEGGPRGIPLDETSMNEALAVLSLMASELARMDGPVAEVVEGYLNILLAKCAHWSRGAAPKTARLDASDPVHRFRELVERDFLEQRRVSHYADLLSITADHLNECVKGRMGHTASRIILDRLMLEAKRLLLHSGMSIKEISYALHMEDPAYFTRWFRKAAGTAPAAYRTHIRELYQP